VGWQCGEQALRGRPGTHNLSPNVVVAFDEATNFHFKAVVKIHLSPISRESYVDIEAAGLDQPDER
jgi:hypothetical protein